MPAPHPWNPVHPDTLAGVELAEMMALFGDIDWANQAAVGQRVAELHALNPD